MVLISRNEELRYCIEVAYSIEEKRDCTVYSTFTFFSLIDKSKGDYLYADSFSQRPLKVRS
jgi:hypothetical protein